MAERVPGLRMPFAVPSLANQDGLLLPSPFPLPLPLPLPPPPQPRRLALCSLSPQLRGEKRGLQAGPSEAQTRGRAGRGGRGGRQTLCAPRLSTEKAARCLRSSSRIFSSSESGSRGLLYSSSSFSEAARSPPEPAPPGARDVEDEGSRALFFLHLVLRF